MTVKYSQLQPGANPPDISEMSPYKCVVVIEDEITDQWMWIVSTWLIATGCLWMNAWGKGSGKWDAAVDDANLVRFNWGANPEDDRVMTCWSVTDPLSEAFWFTKTCSNHRTVDLQNTLILHISSQDKETEMLEENAKA